MTKDEHSFMIINLNTLNSWSEKDANVIRLHNNFEFVDDDLNMLYVLVQILYGLYAASLCISFSS